MVINSSCSGSDGSTVSSQSTKPKLCRAGCWFPIPDLTRWVSISDLSGGSRGNIIRTVLCCIMYDKLCTMIYTYINRNLHVGLRLDFIFVH